MKFVQLALGLLKLKLTWQSKDFFSKMKHVDYYGILHYFRKQVDHGMRFFTGSRILFLLCIDTKARNWFWIFVEGVRGELGFIQHGETYVPLFKFNLPLFLQTWLFVDRLRRGPGDAFRGISLVRSIPILWHGHLQWKVRQETRKRLQVRQPLQWVSVSISF